MTTTTIHPVFAPVVPAPDPDHIARVDALLAVYEPPTAEQWRAKYRAYVRARVADLHGHRKGRVPARQLARTIRRTRELFVEIRGGEYGLDPAVLFAPGRPDRGARAVLEAQEGSDGGGLWSASKREEA
jgi:hypothetical protein